MAAFESLSSLFETPLPDSPTLLESLSWNQIKPAKPPDDDAAAFTEIFGELHFEERTPPPTVVDAADPSLHASFSSGSIAALGDPDPSPSTSPWLPAVLDRTPALDRGGKDHENLRGNGGGDPSRGSSPGSSRSGAGDESSPGGKDARFQIGHADSFQLCTEGLGFESSDDHVEDSSSESSGEHCCQMKEAVDRTPRSLPAVGYAGCPRVIWGRRPRTTTADQFPPPITCIGSSGKPCFRFSSHREGGRFVLREVRLPHRVLLHASRKDGRLRLQFVQPDEEIIEEEEEEEIIEEEGGGESSEEGDDAEGDHAEE